MAKWAGIALAATLVAAAPVQAQSLDELMSLKAGEGAGEIQKQGPRETAVREAALSLGARAGFADFSTELVETLEKHAHHLDKIFDFSRLVVIIEGRHVVMPPVIAKYGRSLEILNDGKAARERDLTYKVVEPARLVAQIPNWREYLIVSAGEVELPDRRLFPKTDAEERIWKNAVKEGWEAGRDQGMTVFQEQLDHMERTLAGMALYRELVRQEMVNDMYVANSELGIQVASDHMEVGGRIVRITQPARFNGAADEWKPVVIRGKRN